MPTYYGVVQSIVSEGDEGWQVVEVLGPGGKTRWVGRMPELDAGDYVVGTGELKRTVVTESRAATYAVAMEQFEVASVILAQPKTADEAALYISGQAGLGPSTATKVAEALGEQAHIKLLADPSLAYAAGLGPAMARRVANLYRNLHDVHLYELRMDSLGIADAISRRARKEWGIAETVRRLEQDPWWLLDLDMDIVDVRDAARAAAAAMGLEERCVQRVGESIMWCLYFHEAEGSTVVPVDKGAEYLDGDWSDEELRAGIDWLVSEGRVAVCEQGVQLAAIGEMEQRVGDRLRGMAALDVAPPLDVSVPSEAAKLRGIMRRAELGFEPTDEQKRAAWAAVSRPLVAITGGPGTGKTTTLRLLVHFMSELGLRFALCSYTGKAADRMASATGLQARTIHSLLEADFRGVFGRDRENPLNIDICVVDEMSMVSLEVLDGLLGALPPTGRLVMLGDVDQLPSVDSGACFADIIGSGAAHVVRLSVPQRQASDSGILTVAERVRAGDVVVPPVWSGGDVGLVEAYNPWSVQDAVVRLVEELGEGVQVLAPHKSGPVGARELARVIRERVGRRSGPGFQVGDRVIQAKNDHTRRARNSSRVGVTNGEMGVVVAVDKQLSKTIVVVRYADGREIGYQGDTQRIEHAECLTVHKSQGSEFAKVVLVVTRDSGRALRRQLVYTGLTRGREAVVVVGDAGAWAQAVSDAGSDRRTRLRHLLSG